MTPSDTLEMYKDTAAEAGVPQGFEERTGSFPLRVEFTAEGQMLKGVYKARETFEGDKKRQVLSHHIALAGISPEVKLYKGKDMEVEPKALKRGQLVSLTGAVIDKGLTQDDIGREVHIIYAGLGEKKKGRNQAKLFRILVGAKAS